MYLVCFFEHYLYFYTGDDLGLFVSSSESPGLTGRSVISSILINILPWTRIKENIY